MAYENKPFPAFDPDQAVTSVNSAPRAVDGSQESQKDFEQREIASAQNRLEAVKSSAIAALASAKNPAHRAELEKIVTELSGVTINNMNDVALANGLTARDGGEINDLAAEENQEKAGGLLMAAVGMSEAAGQFVTKGAKAFGKMVDSETMGSLREMVKSHFPDHTKIGHHSDGALFAAVKDNSKTLAVAHEKTKAPVLSA